MSNQITAYFKGTTGVAEAVYQNDYGIVMNFDGIYLPAHFDCYFSIMGSDTAIPGVGADNIVAIPNSVLAHEGKVTVHIPLHTGSDDSEVEYVVYFKVIGRARPEDDGTPVQMTAIERALALLTQPITNIEEIVNEALSFTGETFDEMRSDLQGDYDTFTSGVNDDIEDMQEDIAGFKTEIRGDISDVESDFDNLSAQFQTAIGAVTVDDELLNVRVGADNKTYTSAGEAVRTQFSNLKSDLATAIQERLLSGNIIHINDGTENESLKNITCGIDYWPSGRGSCHIRNITSKNLLNITGTTATVNSVTFTVSGNTITANGTAELATEFVVNSLVKLKGGTSYILSGCPSGGSAYTYRMNMSGVYAQDIGNGSFIFTPSSDGTYDCRIMISAGTVCNDLVFTPMLRLANTSAEYEPYSEDLYLIGFPVMVYGGVVDVTNGVLTCTLDQSGNELDPPVVYSVTPKTIEMKDGSNNFYSNVGNTEIDYYANVGTITTQKINSAKEDVETKVLNIAVSQESDGIVIPLKDAAKNTLVKGLEYTTSPSQNYYGYEKPWAGGTDINLLRNTAQSAVINGLTFTVNPNGTINVNGTAYSNTTFLVNGSFQFEAGKSYILNGCPSGGGASTYKLCIAGAFSVDTGSGGAVYTPSANVSYDVRIIIYSGQSFTNALFKPMLRYASITDPTYRPWANVCPVIGKSAITIDNYTNKNLLKITSTTQTINGITFTVNADGSVTVNGTASNHAVFYLNTSIHVKNGFTYVLNGCPSGGSRETYYMSLGGVYATDIGNGSENFAPSSDMSIDARITIMSGQTMTNAVFYPMLRYNYDADPTFVKASITTNTIPLPIVLYGGIVSVTDGKLISNYDVINSYSGQIINGKWMSSLDLYEEGATPTVGAQVVYELNNPVTYYFDPYNQIRTSNDKNTLVVNSSDPAAVTYIVDMKSYIEQNLNGEMGFNYQDYETHTVTSALTVGIPILYLNGDTSTMTKEHKVNLNYIYKGIHGSCSCKWQGASSIDYSKKNYTVTLDNNIELVPSWGSHKKYVLKADYIDFSHTRNIVSAKLWGQVAKSRNNENAHIDDLPNAGAIDGFPIMLVINNEFHGLYSMTIPKDKWLFDMGSGENEGIVSAETHSLPTRFKATITEADLLAETSFSVEYAPDEEDVGWMAISISNAITSALNASSAEDIETLDNYIDINSVIDHYIFACLIGATDCTDKNYLLATWDGTKWYMSEYDLDTTFGNTWTGNGYVKRSTIPTFASYADEHRLMYLIYHYAPERLKSRYNELRASIMSEDNVAYMFYNYGSIIPRPIKEMDARKWPLLPATDTNTIEQIVNWYRLRVAYLDAEIEAL